MRAFAERRGLKTPLIYGGADAAEVYGARPFPFSFVVGGNGTVTAVFEGYEAGCLPSVEQAVRKALVALPSHNG